MPPSDSQTHLAGRVAIAHDYVTQRGGAERVVLAMARGLGSSHLYTSLYNPGTAFSEFSRLRIETSAINRIPAFRRDPRLALPLLPAAFNRRSFPYADVLLCSSSGWAHAIRADVPKVVYFHTPPRWLYETADYVRGANRIARTALKAFGQALRNWDQRAMAHPPAKTLVNSSVVKRRVERVYGLDAEILFPPMSLQVDGVQKSLPSLRPGYLLTVSRGRGYKNTDMVVEACIKARARVVVVGGTRRREYGPVLETGVLTDAELRWVYANCSALVAAAHEDFGLTPIEANAFGKPVVAIRRGGYLDTVVDGVSGLFARSQTADSLAMAIEEARRCDWDARTIRDHADRFSNERFVAVLADHFAAARSPVQA